jgi:hypothetical protein
MRQGHPNTDPMVIIRSAHMQPSREEMRMKEDMGFSHKTSQKKGPNNRGGKNAEDSNEEESKDEKK